MGNGKQEQESRNLADFQALSQLALNLHWSWSHTTDRLWKFLDEELWESTQNPWIILQTVSKEKIAAVGRLPEFRGLLNELILHHEKEAGAETWFHRKFAANALQTVAYFSMEFMLTEALPIYSGGLGNVAGDQLKAASDLGVPVVGIGLLYGQGYFRQQFDSQGNQRSLYPVNDPGQLPIRPLRHENGEWLRLKIDLLGSTLWIRCWEASVGRTKLFLLDTNDFANSPAHRGITGELYGGDAEMRLQQEIILGICGWRLLETLDLHAEVCHLNEGHAAFAVLERARAFAASHKVPFRLALCATRAGNLFTTHTAVAAGFDRFDPQLIEKYLTGYAQDELGISIEDLLALGRHNPDDSAEPLNMAYLALRGSGRINGVSRLHAEVSRFIFQPLFPRWPEVEIPIHAVTNGIHTPTWDSSGADRIWTTTCGKERWRGESPDAEALRKMSDDELWQMRNEGRKELVHWVRKRYRIQRAGEGRCESKIDTLLDEHSLTLGFARRFATYKRPNLLLHDSDRLMRLLTNTAKPVQLVLAGKAHPQDAAGQALISQWNDFARRPEVQGRIVFLSDYDMLMAQMLVQGVDVWINTPRRPWEACGTSGMKVLVNGGLNVSELDGWWAEAYSPSVGWAIGDGKEHGDDTAHDAAEADALYSLLEGKIISEFYDRDGEKKPSRWLDRIRNSMSLLTPKFSASRAICEYTESHYIPAASSYRERVAGGASIAADILEWQEILDRSWSNMRFGQLSVTTREGWHHFQVELFLGSLKPEQIRVELFANSELAPGYSVTTMKMATIKPSHPGTLVYEADVSTEVPQEFFTPRVIPYHPLASIPLEEMRILWQH